MPLRREPAGVDEAGRGAVIQRSIAPVGHDRPGPTIPREVISGTVEVLLPEGGRVLVELSDALARDRDVEVDLIRLLLATEGSEEDVWHAIAGYAEAGGLTAQYFLGEAAIVVALA